MGPLKQRLRGSALVAFGLVLAASLPAHATVTYTCAANINATEAGTCNFLNTTISGLYSSSFTNANASIYITYGATALGSSLTEIAGVSYAQYYAALAADSSDDALSQTAFTDSVPASEPSIFGTDSVALTDADAAALGIVGATTGVDQNGNPCAPVGSPGCYNGIITISNGALLWYRSLSGSPQTGSQYDFFSVVEHETDEVLGTASCAFGCDFNGIVYLAPTDLYRYSSNGTRSFGAGNNNSCASSNAGNACFSINGSTMLIQYNNLNNGNDAGDWLGGCPSNPQVQDAVGCPGHSVNITTDGGFELDLLDAIGFTLGQNAAPEPGTFVLVGAALLAAGIVGRRVHARKNR